MSKNIIGGRLREARKRAKPKVTQVDLLARMEVLGVPLEKTTISKIEAGTRSVTDKELKAIAEVLRVSPNWLLGMESGL